jgi:TonB family protein
MIQGRRLGIIALGLLLAVMYVSVGPADTEEVQCPDGQAYIEDFKCCGIEHRLIHKVAPEYPKKAEKRGIEGHVIVQAKILRNGRVMEMEVLRVEPEGVGFEKAAMKAVGKGDTSPPSPNQNRSRSGSPCGWLSISIDIRRSHRTQSRYPSRC